MCKTIIVKPVGKLTFKAAGGGHQFVASEPEAVGGPDAGPTPAQYFIGSIGTCTAMYADLFCARYKIPIDGFELTLEYEQDPKTTQVTSLRISYTYPSELAEELKEKFGAFLDKCAVKKAVKEGFPMEMSAAASGSREDLGEV